MSLPSTYSAFQGMPASEKEGLIICEAAQRLMGWALDSGSVYKLTGFTTAVFSPTNPVQDSGVALAAAASRAAMTAGTYFLDRTNQVLYLQTSDSVNPNGKFISLCFRLFFSRAGRNLPNDLASGFPVHWEPMLEGTSNFNVTLDNQNQLGQAIEGTGTLTFKNDQSFWGPRYDKLTFENQLVYVYSWNPMLPVTQAQIIYRGRIQAKSWALDAVEFTLKDVFNEMTAPVALTSLSSYSGARIPSNLTSAYQRRLYGYLYGHRPTNIDQVLAGYPLLGTVNATNGSVTVTGNATSFLTYLSPNDQITIGLDAASVTIKSVDSDTSLTLSQTYPNPSQSTASCLIKPAKANRHMNRVFQIAGHALREPSTTVASSSSPNYFVSSSVTDFMVSDAILVGGQASTIKRISGSYIFLTTNLGGNPAPGTSVVRPAVSNVYLGSQLLQVTRDYTYSAALGTITLDPLAEFNVAPTLSVTGTVSFTATSASVTGSGTIFTKELSPGDWICAVGQSTFYEVLAVASDSALTLRAVSGYTSSSGTAVRKTPAIYTEGSSVLSLDCLGRTSDATTSGTFLKTAPQIVKDLLTLSGTTIALNAASFTSAQDLAPYRLGLAIPGTYSDTSAPTYRDTIDRVNQSVFGLLYQDANFILNYQILSPKKPAALAQFVEADILALSVASDSTRIVSQANVNYLFKEYDPSSADATSSTVSAVSKNALYLSKSNKQYDQDTLLVDAYAAQIFAYRWAFIFEVASSVLTIQTKMKGSTLQINDPVSIKHAKLYQRVGSTEARKIAAVHQTTKSIVDSTFDLEDLANAFSRCSIITPSGANSYFNATADERLVNGYVTDSAGMQNNDPNTFGVSLIW